MATTEADERPPIWRNIKVLGWVYQLAVLGIVVAIIAFLISNFRTNSAELGIPTGFDFLDNPAGFPIAGSGFRTSQPVRDALVVGARNTVYVSIAGIVLATILGVLVGIARLSGNWLLSTGARVFVEILRNIPLLAIVAFAYLALVLQVLPRLEDAWEVFGVAVFSNRAAAVPWYQGSTLWLLGAFVLGVVVAWLMVRWRERISDRTGATAYSGAWALGSFIVVFLAVCAAAGLRVTTPELDDRTLTGGIEMTPEFLALLVALTIYTASHIAEITRGSIQAVDKGQQEAADAVALSPGQRMWYVILPQAMRIAIPPLGNQYLNLFKNSSLGAVISYFELTKVGTTAVANNAPAVPVFTTLL
ncbi:MAG: ABC transporter permease subunit, partial [Acidimicrobiia bacterium]|nr:ABC transporter permease subunit [Acidimicrobiia bacterium]